MELNGSFRSLTRNSFSYTGIKELTVPGNVVEVDGRALDHCNALTSLTFEEGLLRINSYAIVECGALETVTLPSTLREMSGRAFEACTALKDVWVYNPNMKFYTWQDRPVINGGDPIIHGYVGSTAQAYAFEQNLRFMPLEMVYNPVVIRFAWSFK